MSEEKRCPSCGAAPHHQLRTPASRDSEAMTALKEIQQEGVVADRQSVDFLQTIINRIVAIATTAILKGTHVKIGKEE